MTSQMTPRDLLLFGGSCAVFGIELANAFDRFDVGARHVALPALIAALALVSAALTVRAARSRASRAGTA